MPGLAKNEGEHRDGRRYQSRSRRRCRRRGRWRCRGRRCCRDRGGERRCRASRPGADRYADYQNQRNAREAGDQSPPDSRQQQTQQQSKPADQKASDKPIDLGDGVSLTGAQIRELLANKAAEDSKRLSRPQSPDAYKAELPADFKPPEGLNYQFNADDPLLAQAKAIAHAEGLSQEGFSRLLAVYAGSQVASQQQVAMARNAEIAKLGTTGPARIDALDAFFKASLGAADGAERMARIFTARDISIAEKEMAKMQGASSGANFSQRGREAPPVPGRKSDEEVARMSPAQRLDYARGFDQSKIQQTPWRDPRL
jgi:hypothetical protein